MSSGCEYYEALLLRLPDGDLTDGEADALREHLRTCRDCRRLFRALEAAASVLEEDMAEPPAELAENVIGRVYTARDAANAQSASVRRVKASHKRRWRNLAVAACLLLIIGGAGYMATHLLSAMGSAGQVTESIVMESESARAAEEPVEAPVPEPEEDLDGDVPAAMAITEEAAEAEAEYALTDMGPVEGAAAGRVWPATSWMEPAQVPEGMEDAFEAVITDSHEDASLLTTASWDVVAYVEYQGVIYEFLTDDGGQALLWRDAAEGVYSFLSPRTADDLIAIIG